MTCSGEKHSLLPQRWETSQESLMFDLLKPFGESRRARCASLSVKVVLRRGNVGSLPFLAALVISARSLNLSFVGFEKKGWSSESSFHGRREEPPMLK